jgi:hypothetical protein
MQFSGRRQSVFSPPEDEMKAAQPRIRRPLAGFRRDDKLAVTVAQAAFVP